MRTVQKNSVFGSQKVGYGAPERAVCIRNVSDYSPFGVSLDGRTIEGDGYRYGYQGSERDDEAKGSGNSYTTFYRQLDTRVGRWFSIDPVFQPWQSPYESMGSNPIERNDVEGDVDSPIFGVDGKLLGTDDQGVKGKPIIMKKSDFKQGMSHKNAMSKDLGFNSLKSKKAKESVLKFTMFAHKRPDYDGVLNLSEAKSWYNNLKGEPLFVDASKIDLSPIQKSDLKLNDPYLFNYALSTNVETGLVYGSIYLTLVDESKGKVKLGGENGKLDFYNFDIKSYNEKDGFKETAKKMLRNTATRLGKAYNGNGKGFSIFVYKLGTVK